MRDRIAFMALGFPVSPMKAGLGSLPADDANWAFEVKYDGYRALLHIDGTSMRVQSSSGLDMTAAYPELAAIGAALNAESAILDGEIVVLDADGRPDFGALQRHQTQVIFYAFDVVQVNGADTIAAPYEQRRALLTALLESGSNWTIPAHQIGDGAALVAATAAHGIEGVMAKRLGSPYQPGKRSPHWRKVKNRIRTVVTVGGFNVGTGSRANRFGALLVGVTQPDGRLRFAGGVGTGFTQAMLDELHAQLIEMRSDSCPFDPPPPRAEVRDATWVQPTLRAEIEIAEFTNDGYARHASFLRPVKE
jgi:bifunctional non-homologous end joining protein LigD